MPGAHKKLTPPLPTTKATMRPLLTLIGALALHNVAAAACPPAGLSRAEQVALGAAEGVVDDHAKRQALALGLIGCLADPDSVLREQTAYPALRTWLRGGKLDPAVVRTLRISQLAALQKPDAAGLAQPFAALVLADVVHADRLKPTLSGPERAEILQAGTSYLAGLRDYRGYDAKEGWRHAVPHTADLMNELAQNPAIGKQDQLLILSAVAKQLLGASAHVPVQSYQYAEGPRMARAVFSLAARSDLSAADWETWFNSVALTPADRATPSNALYARRHNFRNFLAPLYILLIESEDAAQRERILPYVKTVYKQYR